MQRINKNKTVMKLKISSFVIQISKSINTIHGLNNLLSLVTVAAAPAKRVCSKVILSCSLNAFNSRSDCFSFSKRFVYFPFLLPEYQ